MPDSLATLDVADQMKLQEQDPELLQLLSGNAPASLEAAVLSGSWPAVAPTLQQQADTAKQQQVEALLANGNPFGSVGRYEGDQFIPGEPGNLTAAMALQALDPDLAARLQAEATPAAPQQGLSAEAAARINAQLIATAGAA